MVATKAQDFTKNGLKCLVLCKATFKKPKYSVYVDIKYRKAANLLISEALAAK